MLLDGGERPLATFGKDLARKAVKELERLGVELRMGARVVGVDAGGVDIEEPGGITSRLEAYTTVWAAGVESIAPSRGVGRGDRRRTRSVRTDRGLGRSDAAGTSGGVRGGRHDVPAQPSGRGRGRDTGRPICGRTPS